VLLLAILFGFSVSLLTQWLVERSLDSPVVLIEKFVVLERSYNAGVAFGITFPYQDAVVGVALALVVLLALAKAESLLSHTGFGVIIGGAMANIVDRYPDGLVTDFIRVGTFPSFNAADSFITVGVLLLLLEGFLRTRPFS